MKAIFFEQEHKNKEIKGESRKKDIWLTTILVRNPQYKAFLPFVLDQLSQA